MPNSLETAVELNKMLETGWASATPIAAENVPFTEVEGQAYLETKYIEYTSDSATIGTSVGLKRERTEGVLFIRIRVPLDEGIGLAYQYADTISSFMSNKNPIPDLFTHTTMKRRSGDGEDGWYSVICDVPFTSDNTQ